MKKILSLLLTFATVFVLMACAPSQDEQNKTEFKEYLASNDAITVEEFDQKLSEQENVELPADLFTNVKVENMKLSYKMSYGSESETQNMYLWQNESKIYVSIPNGTSSEVGYLDLAALESLYDQSKEEVEASVEKPSEMVEALLDEIEVSYDLPVDLNFESILSVSTFEFDDFEFVEKGKFLVKNNALFEKIASLSEGQITASEIEDLLKEECISFSLYIYFNGKQINGFEFVGNEVDQETQEEIPAAKLKFLATIKEEEIKDISLECAIPNETEIALKVEFKEAELAFTASLTEYSRSLIDFVEGGEEQVTITKMDITGSISDKKVKLNVKLDGKEMISCELNLINEKLGDVNTLGLNGKFVFISEEFEGEIVNEITISCGNDVVIPTDLKAKEANAINLLESMNEYN